MKETARWLESVMEASEKCDIRMPWERGARRKEMIARREGRDAPERLSA